MNFTDLENYIGVNKQDMEQHTIEALENYIYRFMVKIPFEAINIFNGGTITMDVEKNLDKFINQHRGGLCYENNRVSHDYLTARGFDTKLVSGYVKPPNQGWKKMDTHLSTVVTIDGKDYLADTGFGHFPSKVIPLSGEYVYDEDDIYRIVPADEEEAFLVQTTKQGEEDGEWSELLYLYNIDREPEYFNERFDFTINHPKYAFKRMLLVNIKTPEGHNTMSNNHVTVTTKEGKEKIDVTSDNYRQLLRDYFGLDVRIPKLEEQEA